MREEIPDDDVSLDELTNMDEEEVVREDVADEGIADDAVEASDSRATHEPIRHRNPRRVIEALRESKALRELLADEFVDFDMEIDMDESSLR
jgi:hypothetical protein